ncbi:protein Son-like [Topomyia yanbarensis]|uniref:protein Son-like n=1 Tax=Topomyia yanbarensis TaxID=2498891 RepID=UPI00273C712A|nr:protein Son-like [Topomyia yanbarensis]
MCIALKMSDAEDTKEEKPMATEMFPLNIKIKQEKTTSYEDSNRSETVDKLSIDLNLSNFFSSRTTTTSGSVPEDETAKETKSVEPLKSSNEILTELFKVFNAAPPEIIDDDSNDGEEEKKKKRKHKKKSKKKKKDGGNVSSSVSEAEEGEITKKMKKIKKEKDKEKKKHKEKVKVKKEKDQNKKKESHEKIDEVMAKAEMSSVVVKKEKDDWYSRELKDYRDAREHNHHHHHHHQQSSREEHHQPRIKLEREDHSYREYDKVRARERDGEKERERDNPKSRNKIQIKSLKDSVIFKEAATRDRDREKEKERDRDKDRRKDHLGSKELKRRRSDSDFSMSDEEPYRQGRYYDFYSKKYNSFYASYKEDEYNRNRKRRRSEERERYRKTKSRSRSPQFDKQKLLEIARKNAISMLKKGTLPGVQGLDKESKEMLIMKMKSSGKSVEELTEYCKKISEKDNLNELSSLSEDSDHDADGGSKAFHHPFQIKDPGTIVMNIKNAVPLAPKSAEQTKALLMQFPVSSGAQHRKMENEWVPVETPKPPTQVAIVRPEKSHTKILLVSASFVQSVEQQQPAYTPVNPPPPGPQALPPIVPPQPELPVTAPLPVPPPMDFSCLPGSAALPAMHEPPPMEVYPINAEANKLDVSSIISQRLNAMRKLQDNPADAEAIKLLYNTQKDMSAWASSKFTPGQFMGSTGVQCLSQKELAEGFQPWATRDSLKHTAPVSGGMGMHLLQKMGWVPGEGLGKEKNGSLEPLLLDVKLDKRGLVASAEDHQRQVQIQIAQQHSGRRARFASVKINTDGKHPVSILGEYCSKRKWLPPRYDLVHESGPGHAKNFVFKVIVNGLEYQPAIANNTKKEAKATAAKFCLQQLGILQS